VASLLHLQYSKQTHFNHRTFCKLQKLWNIIHCTVINTRYKNDFVTNHQDITLDSAVKIKDMFVNFADIFLPTHHIHISKLNFKRPIVTTQWHCVQTSVYTLPTTTGVVRLILNCKLTDRLPHEPLPRTIFLLYLSRAQRVFYFALII